MSSPCPITNLPAELMDEIFSYVHADSLREGNFSYYDGRYLRKDRKQDLQACVLVSRLWRDVCQPYLFRDIIFAECPLDSVLRMIENSLEPREFFPRSPYCVTFDSLYKTFEARPELCQFVQTLTLICLPDRMHYLEHTEDDMRSDDPTALLRSSRGTDYIARCSPLQLFSILALFPRLREVTLNDFLFDMSNNLQAIESISYPRHLDKLTIHYPYYYFRQQRMYHLPGRAIWDYDLYESFQFLLERFRRIGELRLRQCTPLGVACKRPPTEASRKLLKMMQDNGLYNSHLEIRKLVMEEETALPGAWVAECLLASPTLLSLTYLDVGSAYFGSLQIIIDYTGRNLTFLRFSSRYLRLADDADRSPLDLSSCVRLQKLVTLLNFDDLYQFGWSVLISTFSSVPYSSLSPAHSLAKLEVLEFQTNIYHRARDAEHLLECERPGVTSLRHFEDALLALVRSEPPPDGNNGTRVVFARGLREMAEVSYKMLILLMFPRLRQCDVLEFSS